MSEIPFILKVGLPIKVRITAVSHSYGSGRDFYASLRGFMCHPKSSFLHLHFTVIRKEIGGTLCVEKYLSLVCDDGATQCILQTGHKALFRVIKQY